MDGQILKEHKVPCSYQNMIFFDLAQAKNRTLKKMILTFYKMGNLFRDGEIHQSRNSGSPKSYL